MSHGFGSGPATIGRGAVGLSVTRGSGSPGGDDLHLGLSSHELGLGNNFGLDATDNVLSRAARVGTSPTLSGIGSRASQGGKGSQANGDGSKGNSFKKDKEQE